jgi:hypothetical protein
VTSGSVIFKPAARALVMNISVNRTAVTTSGIEHSCDDQSHQTRGVARVINKLNIVNNDY